MTLQSEIVLDSQIEFNYKNGELVISSIAPLTRQYDKFALGGRGGYIKKPVTLTPDESKALLSILAKAELLYSLETECEESYPHEEHLCDLHEAMNEYKYDY